MSPCIDAGSPDTTYNDPDGTRNDVGSIFYNQSIVYICGDTNGDDTINIFDVTFTISFLYLEGPGPYPEWVADVNNDGTINIFDATWLISFLYLDGPVPICP